MISFVIPARNEARLLGRTIDALRDAARTTGREFEIVVADDASTDGTAEVARARGARVAPCDRRQIAAARNAGARAARGDVLVFVDADTFVPPDTLAEALDALDAGAIGGGARLRLDAGAARPLHAATFVIGELLALLRYAAGCFVFVRRDAFEAAGGFDERYFASEEVQLSRTLKKRGRFVIVRSHVVTSSRKAELFGAAEHLRQIVLIVFLSPFGALRRRDRMFLWYDIRRGEDRASEGEGA